MRWGIIMAWKDRFLGRVGHRWSDCIHFRTLFWGFSNEISVDLMCNWYYTKNITRSQKNKVLHCTLDVLQNAKNQIRTQVWSDLGIKCWTSEEQSQCQLEGSIPWSLVPHLHMPVVLAESPRVKMGHACTLHKERSQIPKGMNLHPYTDHSQG